MRRIAFRFIGSSCLAVLVIGLLAGVASAQMTRGTINGSVQDQQEAVVAGAAVTIRNTATGEERTETSTESGAFVFAQVAPGTYTLTIEARGFKRTIVPKVVVEVSQIASLTVTVETGEVTESVTVTSGVQEVINTASATLTSVINTRQVQDLPLPGRNPLELAGLQSGVAVVGTGTRTSSISGLRGSATNITQDGINVMDNFVKTDSLFAITAPSLNSTSEFSITTGTNAAEAGRGVAQVSMTTRGGGNDFHGEVFYMNINDGFQANTWFNNLSGTPRTRQNQHFYGVAAGGPMFLPKFGEGGPSIWRGRDRAFWFYSNEFFREKFSVTRNRTVLTATARTGQFRYVGSNGATQTVNLLTIGPPGVNTLNPITLDFINRMPLPNNTLVGDSLNTSGFRFNVNGDNVSDKHVWRYDHEIVKPGSPVGGHKLEWVMNRATFSLTPDTFNSLEAPFPGGIDAGQRSTRWLVTLADHMTFGNITNEFRYGRQWAPVGFIRDADPDFPFHLGFASVTNFHNTFMSQGRNTSVNQIVDNMAIPKGSHTLRLGADFQQIFADTFNDAGIHQTINLGSNSSNSNDITTGDFPFLPAGTTGNAIVTRAQNVFADLTGFLASSSRTFNVTSPTSGFVANATRSRIFKERDLALYFQDQWRAKSNLTLNYGVRWDYQGVPTIPNGLAIQVQDVNTLFGVSGFGNLFNPTAAPGANTNPASFASLDFVSGNTGKGFYKNDWNNFAPFFGFAYSPNFKSGLMRSLFGAEGTSSIRGGYSISYLHDGFTVISNALGTGTTNPGLIQNAANNTPTGVLTGGGVALTTPTFVMPVTDRQNFLANNNNSLWAIDPNLRIPYVQQWSIGYEREITNNMAFEVRYVGNHAVKVWRANNFNEANIFENGFLQEFLNAQRNLGIYTTAFPNCGTTGQPGNPCRFGNSGLAGQVNLPWMSRFFTGLAATSGSGFASSTFISNLNNNNIGTMASTLANSSTYRAIRENPANGIPANYFLANPNAAGITLLSNDAMSNYHALQAEFRRRFSRGLQFQFDYTFSKSLTDARDAAGSQSDLISFRTLRDKSLDYARSNQDQTHRFVANAIYDLPFGNGRQYFSNANGLVNRIVGGWSVGSIVVWQSRPPFYITANRSTFNNFNAGNNPAQLTGISFEEFRRNLGLFRHPTGIYFVNPELLNITTNASGAFVQSTLKPGLMGVPAPGTFGNFPVNSLNGPAYFNTDISLVKRVPITEGINGELKTTFINIFNHPNFTYNGNDIDSTSFGRITSQSGNTRVIHFIFKVTW